MNITNNEYEHVGKPLTPSIAGELILELCKGEILKRKVIIDRAYQAHLERGGEAIKYENAYFAVALKTLKKKRLVNNKGLEKGYWEIPHDQPPDEGSTGGCVYVYYYPTYKEHAKLKGEDRWPCKIGFTNSGNPEGRARQQATGMPEEPITEVVIYTENPEFLEKIIHFILKDGGMHIEDAPRTEWFLITPDIAKKVAEEFKNIQNRLDFKSSTE